MSKKELVALIKKAKDKGVADFTKEPEIVEYAIKMGYTTDELLTVSASEIGNKLIYFHTHDYNHVKSKFIDPIKIPYSSKIFYLQKVKYNGRWVAIKRIKTKFLQAPHYQDLLFDEFKQIFYFEHPNIVKIYGKGIDEFGPYYYMEYIDGKPLSSFITAKGVKNKDLLQKFANEILQAINYLHDKGLAHQNLNPDNIFVTNSQQQIKIIDSGIGERHAQEKFESTVFVAPEQKVKKISDHRVDIYAFGCMLLKMISGKTNKQNNMLAPRTMNIIHKASKINPDDRYQTSKDIGSDLRLLTSKDFILRKIRNKSLYPLFWIIPTLVFIIGTWAFFDFPTSLNEVKTEKVEMTYDDFSTFGMIKQIDFTGFFYNEKKKLQLYEIKRINREKIRFKYILFDSGDAHWKKFGEININSNGKVMVEFETLGTAILFIDNLSVYIISSENPDNWNFEAERPIVLKK